MAGGSLLRVSSFILPPSSFFDTDESTISHLSAAPMKETELLPSGIDDQRDLPALREKVSLNKQVIARQKPAHPGMRVLPAEQRFARKMRLDLAAQRRPGLVRKCQ